MNNEIFFFEGTQTVIGDYMQLIPNSATKVAFLSRQYFMGLLFWENLLLYSEFIRCNTFQQNTYQLTIHTALSGYKEAEQTKVCDGHLLS